MSTSEVSYLRQLVEFKTISADGYPKSALANAAEAINSILLSKKLSSKILIHKGYPSIIATTKKTKTPKVFLQAHLDVVPGHDELFKLAESEDKVQGRGVFDMKFAGACYLSLLDRLDEVSKYDFGLMLTFDEEIGGENGVKTLLDDGYLPRIAILPDAGRGWVFENKAKGVWHFQLRKMGKTAHSSQPNAGINAIEEIIEPLNKLKKIRDSYKPENLTAVITMFDGGSAMNQIPDKATADINVRYLNKSILSEFQAKIHTLAETHNLELKQKFLAACIDVPTDNKLVGEFVETAEQVLGKNIPTEVADGSTDGRFFCAKNIPVVQIQPNGGGWHSDDEWADKNDLKIFTEILYKYITKYAKV